MKKHQRTRTFRDLVEAGELVRVAGAHDALGGKLAERAGFDSVWASSFETSAARCLPDASVLSMTDYLDAAAHIQKALTVPIVADVDTGYGGNLNVTHMVHEYESAGITAVALEDKLFPKMNSFADASHSLLDTAQFASKITVAKNAQTSSDFFLIARTEAFIAGLGLDEAIARSRAYADAGADAILIHSKARDNEEILRFLERWDSLLPVVIVPTTYPDWHADDLHKAGVSVVIYANQGLRATVAALNHTFQTIIHRGATTELEPEIASVREVFDLQQLDEWQRLDA